MAQAPKKADQLNRAAYREQHRHDAAMKEANPACRRGDDVDRLEDVAFNIACRKFEIEQWQ